MYNRSRISLKQFTARDGTSNTLLFGEVATGQDGATTINSTWVGGGALPTAWGLPDTNPLGWWHFSSRHSGVIQFALGDGAVRPVRKGPTSGTAWINYVYASGWKEGAVFDLSTLGN